MGYNFAGDGAQAATANDTVWNLASATTIRPELYYLNIGTAVVADAAYHLTCGRTTGQGTAGSTPTPVALDPDHGVASKATFTENHSSEPTYTSAEELLSFNFTARNTNGFQWTAPPGRGLLIPSTADNGIGLLFVVATDTSLCQSCAHWNE